MKVGLPTVQMEATLTRDPEVKFTQSGKAVASLSVVCNERTRGSNGQWQDGEASFFDVTVWPKASEHIAESVKQGDRVLIIGYLQMEKWQTKDGDNRSKIKVVADHIGPSMTFGVAKTGRALGTYESGGSSGGPQPADPWASAQGAGGGDEPPF